MTSVARRHDDSGEYSDGSQDIEPTNSENEGGPGESDYDSAASDSERSDRDPDQSQESERRVDHDEDRSNPQYIPKRGTFYEHDDRTAASGEETANTTSDQSSEKKEGSEAGTERRRPPRKSDVINKWSHDKFNENEQMPKSREELVAIYGYDIRNEDAPPHARRNRRYGRGPNKYTRTWEDEEAYKRQAQAQAPPRKPPNPDDFPHLDAVNNRNSRKPRSPRPRSKSQPNSNESLPSENGSLRRNASIKTPKKPMVKQNAVKSTPKPVKTVKREEKMPNIENLTITASVGNSQGARRVTAQQRPVPTEMHKIQHNNTQQPQPQSNPPQNKPPPQQQPPPKQQQPQQQQQPGAESRGGSKRYSSLRQRPLAENYTPQQQQQPQPQQQQPKQQQPQPQQLPQQLQQLPQQPQLQQHRYNATGTEFAPAAAQHPQHVMHQQVHMPAHASPPLQHATQQHTQQQAAQRLLLEQQQQLVAHHTMHSMPQHGQLPPTQGYAPPAMMPAQYMQQAGRGGGVYGGAVFAPTQPYTQIYPHHNYATQAGGVTYFSCAEQEQPARQPRRPTAAIPIVKPQHNDRAANSSEKDNIDRIVENMFVRKPWPATQLSADSKEKSSSESRSSQEPTKEQSQPNSLTSSSISTDSKPSEIVEEHEGKNDQGTDFHGNSTNTHGNSTNTHGNSTNTHGNSANVQGNQSQENQESISTDA